MLKLYKSISSTADKLGDNLLPLLARFSFAAVLFMYFWKSGLTKFGDGFFGFLSPSFGAYSQIFPRQFEAAGYDTSAFGIYHWAVVTAGTWAEFILPVMIVIGLLTRLSALGMIGFVIVQTLTDLFGHGGIEHAQTFGAWFDNQSGSLIMDQRTLWMLLLITLVMKGGGWLSLDRFLKNRP